MDKLLIVLNDYLHAAAEVVQKYTPQVWNSTLQLIRIQAVAHLAILVFLAGLWVALILVLKNIKSKLPNSDNYDFDKQDMTVLQSITLSITGGIWLLVFLCNFMDIVLGIWNPQLYLLYQVAEKAGIL